MGTMRGRETAQHMLPSPQGSGIGGLLWAHLDLLTIDLYRLLAVNARLRLCDRWRATAAVDDQRLGIVAPALAL